MVPRLKGAVRHSDMRDRPQGAADRTCEQPATVAVRQLEGEDMQLTQRHEEYWSRNLRITAILLAIWFVVTFVVSFFARDLNFNFFGWPFSFYMGAQGSLVIYMAIIWYYAHYMNKLDQEHGVAEEE